MPKVKVEFLKQCLSDLVQEYKHLKCEDGKKSFDQFLTTKVSDKENQILNKKDDLDKHSATIKCTLCGKKGKIVKFVTKDDLDEHIKKCHSLKCEFCSLDDIKTNEALEVHKKKFHKFESTYFVEDKIGNGAFGEVRKGKKLKNGKDVAIKLESDLTELPLLQKEYRIYR